MTENLKKFAEEASKNEELKEKLMQLTEDSLDQVIVIAKEYGFELTEEDLKPENLHPADDEKISFDELDSAAGGTSDYGPGYDNYGDGCFCALGGGKTGTDGKPCGCVGYGHNVGMECIVGGDANVIITDF